MGFLAGLDQPGGVESQPAIARPQDFAQRRQVDGVLALVVGGAAAVPAVALGGQPPGRQAVAPLLVVAAHHVAVGVHQHGGQGGVVLVGLAVVLLAIWTSARSLPWMVLLTGLLGALTYAAVPALQARVIGLSHIHAPRAPAVAAGLNIAGFNGGIALGSLLGGVSRA